MARSGSRTVAAFPGLFAFATACGPTTPEAVRPAPAGSVSAVVVDLPPGPPTPAGELIMSQDACQSDADCIPASCCHPTACMSKDKARPCNMMCTQVCMPGTLDCGGSCLCNQGRCAARLGNGGR